MICTRKQIRQCSLSLCMIWAVAIPAFAQSGVENALLWKVSGKNLKEPSYIFGTFHLMGNEYIDSLSAVTQAFQKSRTLAGEMVMDESMSSKLMEAAIMKDSTLKDIMSPEAYQKTAQWFNELTGMNLQMLNRFNPSMIQMFLVVMLQQNINQKQIVPMDLYFQNLAKENKKIVGLESFEDQVDVLFNSTTYKQQAQHLIEFVNQKDSSVVMLLNMNRMYRAEDLAGLMTMFFSSSYSSAEQDALLTRRNNAWIKKLPALFEEQSTFVAVGALHLPGEDGLIRQLRRLGYQVTPLNLR